VDKRCHELHNLLSVISYVSSRTQCNSHVNKLAWGFYAEERRRRRGPLEHPAISASVLPCNAYCLRKKKKKKKHAHAITPFIAQPHYAQRASPDAYHYTSLPRTASSAFHACHARRLFALLNKLNGCARAEGTPGAAVRASASVYVLAYTPATNRTLYKRSSWNRRGTGGRAV